MFNKADFLHFESTLKHFDESNQNLNMMKSIRIEARSGKTLGIFLNQYRYLDFQSCRFNENNFCWFYLKKYKNQNTINKNDHA